MSAPSNASARACATAASASRYRPPSENESGVTFTIPIRRKAPLEWARALKRSLPWVPGLGQLGALGICAAQLGGPSREARPGYRARSFALGAPGGRGGRAGLRQPWPRLLLDAEHLLLALAGEQRQELLLLDRLALDEDLGDLHQI